MEAIQSWPVLKCIHGVRSFYGLDSFYRWFIRNFSTIIAAMTEVINGPLRPILPLRRSKQGLFTPMLSLPCFGKVFEIECHACGVGVGGVLTYKRRPLAFFSKILCDSRREYSTFDKEFYATVWILEHWSHYLVANEFILHSNHKALKYIQGQHKLNSGHGKWVVPLVIPLYNQA